MGDETVLTIRGATGDDWAAIWPIFREVVSQGDTYVYAPDTEENAARGLWLSPSLRTYVALEGETVVGTYWLKPNQPGLGAHVANAAFMVRSDARGHGVGRTMAEHALREARVLGYAAMQFNLVVGTNDRAVRLWQSLGFTIVGTLPQAYRHSRLGLVDAYVMYRVLDRPI